MICRACLRLAVLLNKHVFYDTAAHGLTIALNHKQNEIPLCVLLQHQQYAKSVQMSDKPQSKVAKNLEASKDIKGPSLRYYPLYSPGDR